MEDFRKIAVLENEVEAGMLETILTERDIPHVLRSYHDFAYDGLFQMQKGWGRVEGPASRESEILEIIADIRKGVD